MAYVKQEWVTGEVITKAKLEHIEEGISNMSKPPVDRSVKLEYIAPLNTNAAGGQDIYRMNRLFDDMIAKGMMKPKPETI